MKFNIFIISFLLFFTGCVQHTQKSYLAPEITPIGTHRYEITVLDAYGNPLEGVKVDYDFKTVGRSLTNQSHVTLSDGKMHKSFIANSTSNSLYSSTLSFKISKDGYSNTGRIGIESYDRSPPIKKETVSLIFDPILYLDKNFAETADSKLKNDILNFVNSIGFAGFFADSVLQKYSINLVSFINNDYLHFLFENKNVYNSIQLSKYDIGKQLFDNVVRKILNPLNDNISESDYFYGYDVSIIGYTKSFLDKDAVPEQIKYKFFIPREIVRHYKNWEISNQQLVDSSIILMDNDRIELRFQ